MAGGNNQQQNGYPSGLAGLIQREEDARNVLGNAMTFGLAPKIYNALGGDGAAHEQEIAAARQRLGITGDVLHNVGEFAGGTGVAKGALKLPGIIKAVVEGAPAAAGAASDAISGAALNAARSVGLAKGITRAETLARLGIDAGPNLAERAVGAATSIPGELVSSIAAHPIKSALLALGVGAPALADYAARNGGQNQVAVTAAAPAKAAAQPAAQPGGKTSAPAAAPTQVLDQNGNPLNPTFSQLAAAYQAANGGQISLRALSALAGVAAQTSPAPRFAPITPQSIAAGRALMDSSTLADIDMKRAQSEGNADAYRQSLIDQYARENSISHTGMYDPLTGLATGYPGAGQ